MSLLLTPGGQGRNILVLLRQDEELHTAVAHGTADLTVARVKHQDQAEASCWSDDPGIPPDCSALVEIELPARLCTGWKRKI